LPINTFAYRFAALGGPLHSSATPAGLASSKACRQFGANNNNGNHFKARKQFFLLFLPMESASSVYSLATGMQTLNRLAHRRARLAPAEGWLPFFCARNACIPENENSLIYRFIQIKL